MKSLHLRHLWAAVAAGAALAWWWSLHAAAPGQRRLPIAWPSDTVVQKDATPARHAAVAPARQEVSTFCAAGTLRWQANGETSPGCIATRVSSIDSGSLRSDRIDSLQGDGRWLRIDSIGRRVVAVQAGHGAAAYGCTGAECRAVSISERDLQGVRRIAVDHLALSSQASAGTGLRVSGVFEMAGSADRDAACAGQSITVARANGVVSSFCPQDGTALSVGDDGSLTYAYGDLEGRTISVHTDAQGRLLAIGSAGSHCLQAECTGADVSAPDAQGLRTLQLRGTMLQGAAGWTQLDGLLLLPP
jgi:hypothetical protein